MRKALILVVLVSQLVPRPAFAARRTEAVCGPAPVRTMRCHAEVVLRSVYASVPSGLSPSDVKRAYRFPTSATAGRGQTIAVVAAHNSPHAEHDLGVFSRRFGLPECSRTNGCFSKVNQTGRTNVFPATDPGWALEISMDVQWVHAIAPGAKILLVEAQDASLTNLMLAEDYARSHARYVSNSWGTSEFDGEAGYDAHFRQTGVSVFVSSGDDGAGAEWPSSVPSVISVGGTTLKGLGTSTITETGWAGSGGGCSHYETAAAAQANFTGYRPTNCAGRRATPDLSLVGDPASGVSVYDSTAFEGATGWFVLGGTSASAPMAAARAAVSGRVVGASYVYGSSITYRDITVGNNGYPCRTGFDLVTGRGSWTG